ncbi:benzoylformate decarboxylase [Microbacterium halophytorum]|uniref:benzoylformate decarboxylase n=1 Tax=Microbacterium halophytorum TaxID=2067568 RepID=UPI000CFBD4A6|nr:benzoylformate decarboxylase [Microbacterium halophytorum]
MTRATVRDTTYEILRAHGMTTVFGNPGSNELPFLAGMPDDFRYVLGLHEGAVVGMADGYAQATGRPAFVSLHAASGTGNAMGALTNAHYAHSPLVLLAGQQVRSTVGQEVMLSSVDAALLPRPLVKHSHEPLSPDDVSRSVAHAIHEAGSSPRGPVYLSVPYDDWSQPAPADDALLASRSVRHAAALDGGQLAALVADLDAARAPVLVLGPDVDAERAQPHAVALAERLGAPVWVAPSPSRCPFPTTHPHFRGQLQTGKNALRGALEGHDLIVVIGAPAFRYHRYEEGSYLPEGTRVLHLTQDPSEAARAPFGSATVTPVGAALAGLAEGVADRGERLTPRPAPAVRRAPGGMTGEEILEILDERSAPGITYVNETTTLDTMFLERVAMTEPDSYHFPASGGLGFGLPAAVGVSLARPDDTVVAVVGDGSANYGITALWTAAQQRTRTVFVIANNGTYGALRGFAAVLDALDAPGLDVPGIDFVALATGYGVPASRVTTPDAFRAAYDAALAADGPVLIDARIVF